MTKPRFDYKYTAPNGHEVNLHLKSTSGRRTNLYMDRNGTEYRIRKDIEEKVVRHVPPVPPFPQKGEVYKISPSTGFLPNEYDSGIRFVVSNPHSDTDDVSIVRSDGVIIGRFDRAEWSTSSHKTYEKLMNADGTPYVEGED
jgi:hypothetical protein